MNSLETMRYGARSGVEKYVAQIRLTRWVCIGSTIVLFGLTAYYVARAELEVGWTTTMLLVSASAAFMAILFSVGAIWKYAPGAIAATTDELGLTLHFPGGRTKQLRWSDPRFRVIINRTSGVADAISRGRPVQAVSGRLWLQDFLSDESFRTFLDLAKDRGLSVSEGPGLRPGWSRLTVSADGRRAVTGQHQ